MSLDIYFKTPTLCPHCSGVLGSEYAHEQNITHNLWKMADAAGVYNCLWHPDENGFETAGQLIEPLKSAIKQMQETPDKFTPFNASNGWGTLDSFLPWLIELLEAAQRWPDAKIYVSL